MATQDTDFTLELYLKSLRNAHALENEAHWRL